MSADPDLDATIDALHRAVRARDEADVATRLAEIEQRLQQINPLLRGMTYAHVQAVLGEPVRAAAVVQDLLALMPDDGVIHYQLGCYRRDAGDLDGALQAFVRATELDATRVEAWINRGALLHERGEHHQAVHAYRFAILHGPTEADAWRNLGTSLLAMGAATEAAEAFRTASQLDPHDDRSAGTGDCAPGPRRRVAQPRGRRLPGPHPLAQGAGGAGRLGLIRRGSPVGLALTRRSRTATASASPSRRCCLRSPPRESTGRPSSAETRAPRPEPPRDCRR